MSFSDDMESPMKHLSYKKIKLILYKQETVGDGQFKWGTCLLKSNGGVHKVG